MQANKTCEIPHILKIIQGQGDLFSSPISAWPRLATKCHAEAAAKSKRNQFREILSNSVQFGVKFLASCTSREYKVILFVFVRNLNCSFSILDIPGRDLAGDRGCFEDGYNAHNLFTPPLPSHLNMLKLFNCQQQNWFTSPALASASLWAEAASASLGQPAAEQRTSCVLCQSYLSYLFRS